MRKVLIAFLLVICESIYAQTHIEYISEKTDSMALINKEDVDIINRAFAEKNRLDSLNHINEQIISNLEISLLTQDSVIAYQGLVIRNNEFLIKELDDRNNQNVERYSKELKKEKNKKISFQTLTGAGIVVIILLILL